MRKESRQDYCIWIGRQEQNEDNGRIYSHFRNNTKVQIGIIMIQTSQVKSSQFNSIQDSVV